MRDKSIIKINKEGLTDSESLKLRIFQLRANFRLLKIKNVWTFFRLHYKECDTKEGKEKFRWVIGTQVADKDYTDKLEKLYQHLKSARYEQ